MGIQQFVDELEGDFYTISQVAKEVGRHPDTIRKWIEQGRVTPPTHQVEMGNRGYAISLFTLENVAEYKKYAASTRPGRPPKHA